MVTCLFVWTGTGCAGDAFRYMHPGQRVTAFRVTTERDSAQALAPRSATVIVLWALWSESSRTCLKEINAASGGGGLSWAVVAVNFDDEESWAQNSEAIIDAARAAGVQKEVWRDHGHRLVDDWGILSLPSVIIVGGGGLAQMTVRGWTHQTRSQVLRLLGGKLRPEDIVAVDTGVVRCRQGIIRARALWRTRQSVRAGGELARVMRECPDWAGPRLILADWSALGRDTASERGWINSALAADSTDPMALAGIAALALSDGQPETALAFSGRAIAADSLVASAWNARALAHLDLGQVDEAEYAWTILQGLNRLGPEYDLIGARLHEAKGESALAVGFWRRVVEREMARRERPFWQRSRGPRR
jgi:hypothetical protein